MSTLLQKGHTYKIGNLNANNPRITRSSDHLDGLQTRGHLSVSGSSQFYGNSTFVQDLFVNDYARIDALRVGTTSSDPGDGNLYVEGWIYAEADVVAYYSSDKRFKEILLIK